MYGNKKYRNIVCWILIFALAFVPVQRTDAVAPAIAPAMYWGIGSLIVACGVYATNSDGLDYLVADYYRRASDSIKYMWEQAVIYGGMAGYMLINQPMINDMIDYLTNEKSMTVGENALKENLGEIPIQYDPNIIYNVEDISINGYPVSSTLELVNIDPNEPNIKYQYREVLMCNGVVLYDGMYRWSRPLIQLPTQVKIWDDRLKMNYRRQDTVQGIVLQSHFNIGKDISFDTIKELLNLETLDFNRILGDIHEYTVDSAGIGSALAPDREVKVPCPPVPPAEWPDRWIDDLERELNNTTADRYVETMDDEFDWYIDKDGHIYKKPKGEPPKEDDDTKLVPPVPLPFDPIHPQPGEPGPATPDMPFVPAEPCPYCPPNPHPLNDPCPNPYCPNNPAPQAPPYPATPGDPAEPCPYCPPNPNPNTDPCPNPYCPNNPAPQAPPAIPDAPVPDDRYIDFEPLKKLPHIFTTKFPFSLPWDLKRGIESLERGQWDRKFQIAACGNYWPEKEIDISMFDPIAGIARVVFLLVFDFALIFATRRLMGGDV